MSEIKLNTWTWGVVPELHEFAVVVVGGHALTGPSGIPAIMTCSTLRETCSAGAERWYAVLSLGPPEMPEEELRLPEGWEVDDEDTSVEDEHSITIMHFRSRIIVASLTVFEPTRAECVREINRLLEGK